MSDMNLTISNELESVVSGAPWYGSSVKEVLGNVDERIIFNHIGNAHCIAEILLHMTAWTEEVTERLLGKVADEPSRGDWPDPSGFKWPDLVVNFFIAHRNLQAAVAGFAADNWDLEVPYSNYSESVVNYRQTIAGLAQHHAYHLGQISLLNKQLSEIT